MQLRLRPVGPCRVPRKCTSVVVQLDYDTANASIVVIGAHHFGKDPNDVIFASVRSVIWRRMLLLEASPLIAQELKHIWHKERSPAVTPIDRVTVLNAGVCPEERLPVDQLGSLHHAVHDGHHHRLFYTFVGNNSYARAMDGLLPRRVGMHNGLPYWRGQIGSFDQHHVLKWSEHMLRTYTTLGSDGKLPPLLGRYVVAEPVQCRPLQSYLRGKHVGGPVGILLIDTEGFDCRIIGSHDWCDYASAPRMILFEHKHCERSDLAAARLRLNLTRCAHRAWPPKQYEEVLFDRDNVAFVLR